MLVAYGLKGEYGELKEAGQLQISDSGSEETEEAQPESAPEEAAEAEAESTPKEAVEAEAESTLEGAVEAETESTPEEAAEAEAESVPEEAVEAEAENAPEGAVEAETESTPEETVEAEPAPQNSRGRFRNFKLLDQHYEKHGREMGFESAQAYEKAAARVPEDPKALHKTESEDGDDVYYLEATNEFVVVSTDGYIRTYFNPDRGKAYFDKQ